MSVAAGPLTDIQPQPPSATVKVSTGRAKMTRQILTEIPNPFAPVRERPYANPSRLRRVAGPCPPISGDVVADRPHTWRRNVALGAKFWGFQRFIQPDRCLLGNSDDQAPVCRVAKLHESI